MRAESMSDNLNTSKNKAFSAAKEMPNGIKNEAGKVANTFSAKAGEVFSAAADVVETAFESLKDSKSKTILTTLATVKAIDAGARRRPWLFIGGAAVVGGVIGYMLSHRTSISDTVTSNLDNKILGHH